MTIARRAFLRMGCAALMLGVVERYVPEWVASAPLPEGFMEFDEWNRQVLHDMARVYALPYDVLVADIGHNTSYRVKGNQ